MSLLKIALELQSLSKRGHFVKKGKIAFVNYHAVMLYLSLFGLARCEKTV